MPGETHLTTLLHSMQPELQTDTFVFCTLPTQADKTLPVDPIGLFREGEGLTLIVTKAEAIAQGWPYTYECRQITLTVHSSLAAVGFLAAITHALAIAGISVNPVSAYYHDHLFVPAEQAQAALNCLLALTTAQGSTSSEVARNWDPEAR